MLKNKSNCLSVMSKTQPELFISKGKIDNFGTLFC